MVDLVKIRKKAKKQREEIPPVPVEPAPIEAEAEPLPDLPPDLPRAEAHSASSDKLDRFRNTAGTRREGFVTQAPELAAQAGAARVELLTFIIGSEQYAVDIEKIVEIVTPRSVTRIPNADRSIVGIISLRGTVVTVVDVRGKLRQEVRPAGEDTRLIVVDHQGETIGFEVDRVLRVIKLDASTIGPHPVVHNTELDEAIRGVFRHGEVLTVLLDFEKLLESYNVPS